MELIQEYSNALRSNEQVTRCRKRGKAKATVSTDTPSADGFLSHQFLPLWEASNEVLPERETTENGFFKSLTILCEKQGFKAMEVATKPYPYNVLLAYWDATEQLAVQNNDELLLLQTENNTVELVGMETYYTGSTLFYIPVIPLYRLLQDKRQKKCGALLLCVFAYLYRFAEIPYYRNQETYMYWQYEMMLDWLRGDVDSFEQTEFNCQLSELNKAAYIGDVMERKIYSSWHLEHFETLIQNFKPKNEFEQECLKLALTTFEIMQEFPTHTIFSHLQDCEDADETILVEQYISFVANNEGSLFQQINTTVNEDFGNKGDTQLPVAYTFYAQDNPLDEPLDFERKLFPMLVDLCTLLKTIR